MQADTQLLQSVFLVPLTLGMTRFAALIRLCMPEDRPLTYPRILT